MPVDTSLPNSQLGFSFIPGPSGSGMTERDFLQSVVQQAHEREQHQQLEMVAAVVCLAVLAVVLLLIAKRRTIAAAGEEALVSSLAAGVKVGRRAGIFRNRIHDRVQEKVGDKKAPTSQ